MTDFCHWTKTCLCSPRHQYSSPILWVLHSPSEEEILFDLDPYFTLARNSSYESAFWISHPSARYSWTKTRIFWIQAFSDFMPDRYFHWILPLWANSAFYTARLTTLIVSYQSYIAKNHHRQTQFSAPGARPKRTREPSLGCWFEVLQNLTLDSFSNLNPCLWVV